MGLHMVILVASFLPWSLAGPIFGDEKAHSLLEAMRCWLHEPLGCWGLARGLMLEGIPIDVRTGYGSYVVISFRV